ncbi:MAG: ammonium transporter, partial [Chloroflexi bacterium]|nr:ammonium transporter [Chloroflexota bacterium]
WVLWGYSLAFGADAFGGLIGNLSFLGLAGVGAAPNPDYAKTIPHLAFMVFQMMFAVITPALITGAFAERKKFATFLVFSVLWATLVYDPIAHWVWGTGGWLKGMGVLDFAGGTVVHISSGLSALAAALVFGKRRGYGKVPMEPHDITMTVLGAGLLWFGWFGFNAGSALAADGLAATAFVVTNTAAAAAALSWMFVSWAMTGKPSVLGAASGAVAGLVAITPASGYVTPLSAVIIGGVAGALCFMAVQWRSKVELDDSLDVFSVHGVGGIWGALATGIFATVAVNAAGGDGLLAGNPQLLVTQLIAIVASGGYAFIMTVVLLKVLDATMGLRVTAAEELAGLDISMHGEIAYRPLEDKVEAPARGSAPARRK